jgi:host factor-I protein
MAAMASRRMAPPPARGKSRIPPPEETGEEAAYLQDLREKQAPVSIRLQDGEVVHGWIEYYDASMVRLTREGAPNLFIFKHDIAWIAEEGGSRPR